MTLNVEAYEYTPLAQHGVGLRIFFDDDVVPGDDIGRLLVAPGTRVELALQRRHVRDVIDDVGNSSLLISLRHRSPTYVDRYSFMCDCQIKWNSVEFKFNPLTPIVAIWVQL